MKKERIKNIALLSLIILNVLLCSRILIDKKLWPHGYNFFVDRENSFMGQVIDNIFQGQKNLSESKVQLISPQRIMLNTGYQSTRLSLDSSDEKYYEINDMVQNILKQAMSEPSKSVTSVSKEDWYTVLTGKSIYLSYTTEFDSKLFAKFLSSKDSEITNMITSVSNVVISSAAGNTLVYIQNGHEDVYYKISLSNASTEIDSVINYFQTQMDKKGDSGLNIINYAFDLSFDTLFGGQKTILNPMIPIYSNPQSFATINAENPILRLDNTLNHSVIDKILKCFNINANTVRRYTEADGTMVFVENNATLKMSLSGVLEYTAKDGANGLKLSDSSNAYDNITNVANFIDNINQIATTERKLCVSSSLLNQEIKPTTLQITFDYVVNGMPVILSTPKTNHAVTVIAENGYLKKYVQKLRSYHMTNEYVEIPEYINALDSAIAAKTSDTSEIADMYTAYFDDGQVGSKTANWKVDVKE